MRNHTQEPTKKPDVNNVVDPFTLLTPEEQFIEACQIIGGIAESNCHYTAGLTFRINETGKSFDQLTLSELIRLKKEYSNYYNRVFGGKA